MSQLLDIVMQSLGNQAVGNIASKVGLGEGAAKGAIGAVLPMLLGAMAKNSSQQDGASALANALDRDHDGSVLDDIGGFLGGGQANNVGAGILKHVLGGNRGRVEQAVAQEHGLQPQQSAQLMEMLAPLVMGSLGRQKRSQGLDANGLADQLQQFQQHQQKAQPKQMSMLGKLIDRDGDGDIKDDLLDVGKGLLGNLFKK